MREGMLPVDSELIGVVERAISIFSVTQAAREQARVLFYDDDIPEELFSLCDESMTWSIDDSNRTFTSANHGFKFPHDLHFRKQASFRLLRFLAS